MPKYRFGDFTVDSDTTELIGPDGPRDLEPQVFDVLGYLIDQRGRLVTKEELLDNVWGDRFVSESALTTRIKQARRAIDDSGRTQWAIKTVHGRGYRFLPDVTIATTGEPDGGTGPPPASAQRTPGALPADLRADARQLFCGREAEIAQCLDILERSSPDQPSGWIWILGEPGIGKTRLAAEVARAAHDRGHLVLFGRNSEDLKVPHQPFIEILRQALETAGNGASLPPGTPPDLAPLLPGRTGSAASTADREPGSHPDTALDSETLRYRLFEAVASWLGDLASETPVTMIIDDLHWAADSTLQLLGHLQRRAGGAALTLVITARDTAPDINPRVADLLAAGQGTTNSAVVRLDGLSSEDALRLVGNDVDLTAIMEQTAGNPLFLQAVNPADGSVDIQGAVHRRLATLDPGMQDTLRLASVLGLEFDLSVAAAATGREELDLLDDLEQAVAARLLDDIGGDRFRFTHALIRSSLRDELSSARRARMHEHIAAAIHQVLGDDPRHLTSLAFHTSEAAATNPALRPLAIDRLQRAAEASMAQFSFEEAAVLLEGARALADPADAPLRARLAVDQGIAETRSGRNVVAAQTFEDALAAARSSGDVELFVEAALRYEDAAWRPGQAGTRSLDHVREATEALDDALAGGLDLDRDHESDLRARVAIARLRALAMAGRRDEVDAAFADARALAARLDSPDLEASALNVYLGHVLFYEGVGEAEAMVQRLAELEPHIEDHDVALHAVHDRMMHATLTGRFEERRRLARTMSELQEGLHSSFWQFIGINQEAMDAFYRGDLEASEALAEDCLHRADALPEEDGAGTYGLRMFMIRREQDRLASMAPLIRHVLASGGTDAFWTPGLALLLVETGALDEAAEVLGPAKAAGFDLPFDAMWSTIMVLLIEATVALADIDSCLVLRDRFGRLAGSNVVMGSGLMCFGRAERYLGMLSLVVGDHDAAEAFLGAALEADAAGGSRLWSNESRLWLARTRRAQGHSAEADAMLAVVAEQAGASGLRRLERLATTEIQV